VLRGEQADRIRERRDLQVFSPTWMRSTGPPRSRPRSGRIPEIVMGAASTTTEPSADGRRHPHPTGSIDCVADVDNNGSRRVDGNTCSPRPEHPLPELNVFGTLDAVATSTTIRRRDRRGRSRNVWLSITTARSYGDDRDSAAEARASDRCRLRRDDSRRSAVAARHHTLLETNGPSVELGHPGRQLERHGLLVFDFDATHRRVVYRMSTCAFTAHGRTVLFQTR